MALEGGWHRPQSTTTGWPWRPGNDFRLHENGEFFAPMLAAIDAAGEYVLLEMYLVASSAIATRFIDVLVRARARGVRTCVMFDGFGALRLRRADRRRLTDGGAELRFFNPLRLRKGLRQSAARSSQAAADRRPGGLRRWCRTHGGVCTRCPRRPVARCDGRDQRSGGGGLAARIRPHLAALRGGPRARGSARVPPRASRTPSAGCH